LQLSGHDGGYPLSAAPVIAPTGCGYLDPGSWPLWATRLGGRDTSPTSQAAGQRQESWTINGHVWTLTQPTTPSETGGRPVATRDGEPLTISPAWGADPYCPNSDRWVYPASDVEQLLGVRIDPVPGNHALASLTIV